MDILYTQDFDIDDLMVLVERYLGKHDEDSVEYQHANRISDELLGAKLKGYKQAKLCYDSTDSYFLVWKY